MGAYNEIRQYPQPDTFFSFIPASHLTRQALYELDQQLSWRMQNVFFTKPHSDRDCSRVVRIVIGIAYGWGISSNQRVALQDPLQEIIKQPGKI